VSLSTSEVWLLLLNYIPFITGYQTNINGLLARSYAAVTMAKQSNDENHPRAHIRDGTLTSDAETQSLVGGNDTA